MFKIAFKSSVETDLHSIDKSQAIKIIEKIETKLPVIAAECRPLKGKFKGLRRYRIGNYRVIFIIIDNSVIVTKIGHRKNIYK